jgi:hypothetical protein
MIHVTKEHTVEQGTGLHTRVACGAVQLTKGRQQGSVGKGAMAVCSGNSHVPMLQSDAVLLQQWGCRGSPDAAPVQAPHAAAAAPRLHDARHKAQNLQCSRRAQASGSRHHA